MTDKKLDNMMHSYCDRSTEQFEFKGRTRRVRATSIIAASFVLAVIMGIMFIPDYNNQNSFTLTVSAAEIVSEADLSNATGEDVSVNAEELYTCPPLNVVGENIEKVCAYSNKGYIAVAYSAKNYNVTDKYHYEKFSYSDDTPDPLIVIPYVKNSAGEFVEAELDTREAREKTTYTYVEIVDINRNADEKFVSISCYPIDENGKAIMPQDYSSKYNDNITVEVTYLDGEVQTKNVIVAYEDGEMKFDIIS